MSKIGLFPLVFRETTHISTCFGQGAVDIGLVCDAWTLDDAVTRLVRACDAGLTGGCAVLSLSDEMLARTGRTPMALFQRGCDLGDAGSCGILGAM